MLAIFQREKERENKRRQEQGTQRGKHSTSSYSFAGKFEGSMNKIVKIRFNVDTAINCIGKICT